MNSLMYFFPGATKRDATPFEEAGIPDLAADARWFESPMTPSGSPGLFAFRGSPKDPSQSIPGAYDPHCERQTWHRSLDGKFWFGWWKDRIPDATSLKRPRMIDGFLVKLGDGGQWQLPSITHLPASFGLDAEASETMVVKPGWKPLEEQMLWAWDVLNRNWREDAPFDEPVCRKYVAEMVVVNYLLTTQMVYALGLIDSETWMQAFAMTLDAKRLAKLREDIARKGESATPKP